MSFRAVLRHPTSVLGLYAHSGSSSLCRTTGQAPSSYSCAHSSWDPSRALPHRRIHSLIVSRRHLHCRCRHTRATARPLPLPAPTHALLPRAMSEPSFAREFAAGCFAGCTASIVGQPLDTVRIRVQTRPASLFAGPLDAAMKTVRIEGIRGLFRGALPPLIGMGPKNAVGFATQGAILRFLELESPSHSASTLSASTGPRGSRGSRGSQQSQTQTQSQTQSQTQTRSRSIDAGVSALPRPAAAAVASRQHARSGQRTASTLLSNNGSSSGSSTPTYTCTASGGALEGRRSSGMGNVMMAGAVAGRVQCLVIVPSDRIKIQLQVSVYCISIYRPF